MSTHFMTVHCVTSATSSIWCALLVALRACWTRPGVFFAKVQNLPRSSGSEGAQAAKAIQGLVSKVYYVQGGADTWQARALKSRPTPT